MNSANKKAQFSHIYNEWVQPLFNYFYYHCGEKAVAEDLVQEVFIKYWDKIENVKEGKEKSYLFTSAKNLLINRSAHKAVVVKFETNFTNHQKPDTPDFIYEMQEFHGKLQEAISKLTPGEREVFLMNRVDGYKYREIAELLQVSQKAIEKRMHKALVKLRKLYKSI